MASKLVAYYPFGHISCEFIEMQYSYKCCRSANAKSQLIMISYWGKTGKVQK